MTSARRPRRPRAGPLDLLGEATCVGDLVARRRRRPRRGAATRRPPTSDDDDHARRAAARGGARRRRRGSGSAVRHRRGITAAGCRSCGVPCRALHALRRRDAEQVEAVADDLAGRVVQPQARAVQVADRLVAERQHAAVVVPAVVEARRAPRCSGRRGAARAARRPGRRCAGTPAARRAAPTRSRASSSSGANDERSTPTDAALRSTAAVRACAYCT